MNKPNLLEACLDKPLLCDGGMGTQLFLRGLAPGHCSMAWNLENPKAVSEVHQAYAQAGCDFITTNSFSGNAAMLARHGLDAQADILNTRAAEIARLAAGSTRWVLGDVGPLGEFIEPFGDLTPADAESLFSRQIQSLVAGGVDAILIETMSSFDEVAAAIRAARSVSDLPIIATYAFEKQGSDFRTMMGLGVADAVQQTLKVGANIVGANCGTDLSLDDYVALGIQLRAAAPTDAPLILQPNAGRPQNTPQGVSYLATAAEMRDCACALRAAGISIIGGCCGTSPALLAAMKGLSR